MCNEFQSLTLPSSCDKTFFFDITETIISNYYLTILNVISFWRRQVKFHECSIVTLSNGIEQGEKWKWAVFFCNWVHYGVLQRWSIRQPVLSSVFTFMRGTIMKAANKRIQNIFNYLESPQKSASSENLGK